MNVTLNKSEIADLMEQPRDTKDSGGFQSLLVSLQEKLNPGSGELTLSPSDLDRIPRYAFDYRNGGWQSRLVKIFGRVLGPNLGR